MDIATKFASGQEAVEAIFRKDKQPQGRQQEDVPGASAQRGAKKKGKKVTETVGCGEGCASCTNSACGGKIFPTGNEKE